MNAPRGSITAPGSGAEWATASSDELYESLVAEGIRPIIGVYRVPRWAAVAGKPNVPESIFWTEWIKSIAWRYPSAIIEGDNEPNLDRTEFVSPTDAVRMQSELYSKVKSISPTQTVIGPSLTDGPANQANRIPAYLGALYAKGLKGKQDGMNIHPYPSATLTPFYQALQETRSAMQSAQDSVPLYVTEVGTTTGDGTAHVTEEQQRDMNVAIADYLLPDNSVKALMWMTLRENHGYSLTQTFPGEFGYGWLRYDDQHPTAVSPKPVYCTFVARAQETSDYCP